MACPFGASTFGERNDIVRMGRERVAVLQDLSSTDANLYGETQMGGLHVLYVLEHAPTYLSVEQQDDSLSLPHVASFLPVRAAWIIAAAHPTPLSTVIASVGQLSWQAPHSIHASGRTSLAKRPFIAKTPCGQTMLHIAQPVHSSWSYCSVLSADTLNMMILPIFSDKQ